MDEKRMTLYELSKRLSMYAEDHEDFRVVSIGYNSEHEHVFYLADEQGYESQLTIPMYEDMRSQVLTQRFAISRYMLTANRELDLLAERLYELDEPRFFNTHEEAHNAMLQEVAEQLDVTVEALKAYMDDDTLDELGDNLGINEERAWVHDGDDHGDCDWRIFRLSVREGRLIKCE